MSLEKPEITPYKSTIIHQIRSLLQGEDSKTINDQLEKQKIETGRILWDLSGSPEYSEILYQNYMIDVILQLLSNPNHTSELREICVGILGNMATSHYNELSKNDVLLNFVVEQLLPTEDVYVLSETLRFLSVVTAIQSGNQKWLKKIREHKYDKLSVLDFLLFVLENTLNVTVLERVSSLLLNIVYYDKTACEILKHSLLKISVTCLNEALKKDQETVIDNILRILEVLSTEDAKVLLTNEKIGDLLLNGLREVIKSDEWSEEIHESACIVLINLMETGSPKILTWISNTKLDQEGKMNISTKYEIDEMLKRLLSKRQDKMK